jgi:hypothetical protein
MVFPKYALEDLTIGSGSIIGKGNIKEFLSFMISKTPKRKILFWRFCIENLEMLLLKLGKFLRVLICLAHV